MSLTDEDKRWFTAQLNALGGTLDARIEKLDVKIERVQTTLDSRIDEVHATLDTKMRIETTLLTGFHKWASPRDSRLRTHTAALRTFDLDLEALTERVKRPEDQRPH